MRRLMEDDRTAQGTRPSASGIAINPRYYAYTDDDGVHLRSFTCSARWTRKLQSPIASASRHAIAFSEVAQNRLAASVDDRILVFDAETGAQTHVLSGTFRVITTLAWASHDSDVLAAGALDGSISLWTLQQPSCPFWQLPRSWKPCQSLAFNRIDGDILACAHGNEVAIWSRKSPAKPSCTLSVGNSEVTRLAWHRVIPGRVLTATSDDNVSIWDVSQSMLHRSLRNSAADEIFGGLENIGKCAHPIANLQYGGRVRMARWLGEHGLVVLAEDEDLALCYSFGAEWEMLHEVWRLKLERKAVAMIVHHKNGALCLSCVSEKGSESYRIPAAVMDSVGGDVQLPAPTNTVDAHDFATASPTAERSRTLLPLLSSTTGFAPVSVSALRKQQGSFARTSKQLQRRRRTGSDRSKQNVSRSNLQPVSTPATPSSRTMTANLEITKACEAIVGSPMPSLSPIIPTEKPSPHKSPPIEESIELPPLRQSSLDTMASEAVDSDSDEESYANGMRGSGTLLPGGINVPLPKSCGALFSPSGELITFFKARPRPMSPAGDRMETRKDLKDRAKDSKVARLFSTFGNLLGDNGSETGDFASSESDASEAQEVVPDDKPGLNLRPSCIAEDAWSTKRPTSMSNLNGIDGQHTMCISLYNLDGALVPSLRSMGGNFQIFRGHGKSVTDLCYHNATIAESHDLTDAAHIWCSIAILLEDSVPLQLLAAEDEGQEDLLAIASTFDRRQLPEDDEQSVQHDRMHGRLRWADSPLGRDWLVREVIGWAEQRADVHMLAYLSAFMAEACEHVPLKYPALQQMLFAELPSFGLKYELGAEAKTSSALPTHPVPLLRTSSHSQDTAQSSPAKLRQSSQASSRTHSQPTTPFLDSETSILPPIPYKARHGSKFSASASGSVSPEHHRSSFGAAARHYAQSITDKFAQYGTSPPIKKLSGSPSTNELSTSLPTGSGSWSKSVSFASTHDKPRDGTLSRSYTSNDDGYDSERTIEDTSLPHTPKSMNMHVEIKLLNEGAFSDSASGRAKVPLLPPDLAEKAIIWRRYYAEQLRCWGLLMQAAELEKVSGLTCEIETEKAAGLFPEPALQSRAATCALCTSLIDTIAHSCPGCLHTSHLSCVDDYLSSLGDEAYQCPSGCGCRCSDLPMHSVEAEVDDTGEVKSTRTVVKKRSFTDPERWRARVEAESL